MDVRQLEVFLPVAEERSFTRAAERLHLVQSAVSSSIKSLEGELARAAVEALAQTKEIAADFRGQVRGTVNLGLLATPDFTEVTDALRTLRVTYPDVVIAARTSPMGTAGLLQGIVDGSLDVSVEVLPFPIPEQVDVESLGGGDYVFAIGSTHPLAAASGEAGTVGAITADGPGVLDGVDLLSLPRGFSMRDALDDQLTEWGFTRGVQLELPDVGTLVRCIADGLGAGLLPRHMIDADPRVRALEIPGVTAGWAIAIAVRRGRPQTPAMRVLLHALREVGAQAVARRTQRVAEQPQS